MTQLLLLHGALASKSQFDSLLPLLKDKWNAQAINFSGHGGLNIPEQGYTFELFADDILQYANEHNIEKLNIFGYSMGGYAALYFAKLYPERINKIFTLNVKFNWDTISTVKETALLNADKILDKVPAFAKQLQSQHGEQLWKRVLAQTAVMMNELSEHPILQDTDYEQLAVPVLLAVGDKDKTSSIEETVHVYRKLQNVQLWVIPGTPHPFEKVNIGKLTTEINSFFEQKA